MPAISEKELRAQIDTGELGPLYLLTGEEKLLVKRAAKKLIRRAGGGAFPEFNCNEFSGEADMERIVDAAVALPFMAERKCVAVADFNAEARPTADLDRLCELVDDLPETTTLVLYFPTLLTGGKSAKWKKLLDRAAQRGSLVNFQRREEGDLRQMLTRMAERQGCTLTRSGVNRLIEYAGTDLNRLTAELEKLCAYVLGTGEREITPQTVEALTAKSTETAVFTMVRALTGGELQRALQMLDELFYQNAKPVAVLGAMATAYIDMYRVKAALDSGLTAGAPLEYAPEYKPGKDKKLHFRLRNAQRLVPRMPLGALEECLDLLMEADLALKSSRMEPKLILETLMTRLMLAASRRERQ